MGIDARSNFTKAGDKFEGKYATDVYTDEAISTINRHDKTKPLFLDLSYSAPHAISNSRVQVKDEDQVNKKFAYIEEVQRRLYAGKFTK